MLTVHAVRDRREGWVTPDGRTIIAPLPAGPRGPFGPDLRRFVLMQYHQGQTTLPRLATLLQSVGVAISKRAIQRLLTKGRNDFLAENRDVLRAGLKTAPWISGDDTGARHQTLNGYCTQIGNQHFTWFATRSSKSRRNVLDLRRAGHADFVLNAAAFDDRRGRALSAPLMARLAEPPEPVFADQAAGSAHRGRLGFSALTTTPDPVQIAPEGAIRGSVHAHDFRRDAVVLSDDARQFAVGRHALCWVQAERLVPKLDTVTDRHRAAQHKGRKLIWDCYADLKVYQASPDNRRRLALRARFDRIFRRRTGWATLDRLRARRQANKAELLRVLERPEIPRHTNGSENDIRCQLTPRKVSAATRRDLGRDCRDAFLGLGKTCAKLGVAVWDYLSGTISAAGSAFPLILSFRHSLNSSDAAGSLSDQWGCPRFCPCYTAEHRLLQNRIVAVVVNDT